MKYDLKRHNCFWVYQNKTFGAEFRGSFLWSPQFANGWRPHPGYECMKEVKRGDIIFHSVQSAIVAISRARTDCYSAKNPGPEFGEWDRNGWRVDVQYLRLPTPWIVRENDKLAMYKVQPSNGPFLSNGRGKQQYLCNANQAIFDYIMPPILKSLTSQKQKQLIDFLDSNVLFDNPPNPSPITEKINEIADGCKVDAIIVGENKKATLTINIEKFPNHKAWIGKKVGDVLKTTSVTLSYRVERIYKE